MEICDVDHDTQGASRSQPGASHRATLQLELPWICVTLELCGALATFQAAIVKSFCSVAQRLRVMRPSR